ncbi:MAG: formylmethanofuran dehydrogenase subunit C [Methanosarcinales archaeon]
MQTVTLKPKESFKISVEAETITPDNMAGKSEDDIKAIPIWRGNRKVTIGDLFDVSVDGSGSAEETKIVIDGSVPRVKRIGEGMKSGEIVINGDVDMHVGAKMAGGSITVKGNADSWAGREMKAGSILIEGNALHYVGSGYRGETCGMRGGSITVNGNVGDFLGEHMCGGEITVHGNAGILPGISNNGGKITIFGDTTMPGAEMNKGTIIIKGKVAEMVPAFQPDGTETLDGVEFKKYNGDVVIGGKGVLYVKV